MTLVRESSAVPPLLSHLDMFQLTGVPYLGDAPVQTACGRPGPEVHHTTILLASVTCTDCLVCLSTFVVNRFAALMIDQRARELHGEVEL